MKSPAPFSTSDVSTSDAWKDPDYLGGLDELVAKIEREKATKAASSSGSTRSSELLTRGEAAAAGGVSVATIRRLEASGKLRAIVGADSVHRFERAEVEAKVSPARAPSSGRTMAPGEVAARAFELFDDGKNAGDVVRQLAIVPSAASALYREWTEQGGALALPVAVVHELRELGVGTSGQLRASDIPEAFLKLRQRVRDLRAELAAARGQSLAGEGASTSSHQNRGSAMPRARK